MAGNHKFMYAEERKSAFEWKQLNCNVLIIQIFIVCFVEHVINEFGWVVIVCLERLVWSFVFAENAMR